jgi:hypothetical protein
MLITPHRGFPDDEDGQSTASSMSTREGREFFSWDPLLLSSPFEAASDDTTPTITEFSRRESKGSPLSPLTTAEWPKRDEDEFARGKKLLRTLELDALSFSSDTLLHLLLEIFTVELELDELEIPARRYQRFFMSVRERMFHNPYHNFHHVFDVLQVRLKNPCKIESGAFLGQHDDMTKNAWDPMGPFCRVP